MPANSTKILSDSIDVLRFPMAAAVVMLHYSTVIINDATGLLRVFCIIFGEGLCRLAVPFFFFISGYLFFHGLQSWDWSTWKGKLKRRLHTLFIPYIIWIIITLIVLYMYSLLEGEGESARSLSIGHFFFTNGGIKIFWGVNGGLPLGVRDVPLNGALWFIRDLIYYSLITPLIYFFIHRTKRYGVLFLWIIYLLFQGIIPEGFLFFITGSYMQIKGKNIITSVYPLRWVWIITSSLLLLAFYLFYPYSYWARLLKILFFFTGLCAAFSIAAFFIKKHIVSTHPFLLSSSFFIFATHEALILRQIAVPCVKRIFPMEGTILNCIGFFLIPLITLLISMILLLGLKLTMPGIARILTGSRGYNRF